MVTDSTKDLLELEVLVDDPNGDMRAFAEKLHTWACSRRAIVIDRTLNDTWIVRFIIEDK